MRRRAILLLAVAMGCGPGGTGAGSGAATRASGGVEAGRTADGLRLDEHGVGPLRAGLRVEPAAVRALLPGHDIRVEERSNEGVHWDVVIVARGGVDLLELVGLDDGAETLDTIKVLDGSVATGWPLRVGDSLEDLIAAFGAVTCTGMGDGEDGLLSCTTPQFPTLAAVFDPPPSPRLDELLAAISAVDEGGQARLVELGLDDIADPQRELQRVLARVPIAQLRWIAHRGRVRCCISRTWR
jgi:hypothetical protein